MLGDAGIRALISLDGVLRDDRYLDQLRGFPQFQPANLRAALLWIACAPANSLPGFGEGSFPEQARHAEVVRAVFPGLRHHDFSSMSSLQRRRAGTSATDWSPATAGYEAACRLILDFLDSRLNGVPRDLARAPVTLCQMRIRPAAKAPPTPVDFSETIRQDGLARATEMLQLVRSEHPDLLPPFEAPLVQRGYEALATGDVRSAIAVFALTVEAFPESIDGAYGLGKAHLAAGEFARAEFHYRAARNLVEQAREIPAEQKAGILGRIDRILEDLRVKQAAAP